MSPPQDGNPSCLPVPSSPTRPTTVGLSPTAALGDENRGRSNHGVAGVGPSAAPLLPSHTLVLGWRTSRGCNSRREPSTRREIKSEGRKGKTVGAMINNDTAINRFSNTYHSPPLFFANNVGDRLWPDDGIRPSSAPIDNEWPIKPNIINQQHTWRQAMALTNSGSRIRLK